MILLAHNLNVRCVAEGVETIEQLTLLKELGCDFAQGFLFSRPVSALSLVGWLDRHDSGGFPHLPPAPPLTPQASQLLAMHRNGASVHTIAASLNVDGDYTVHGGRWSAKSAAETVAQRWWTW